MTQFKRVSRHTFMCHMAHISWESVSLGTAFTQFNVSGGTSKACPMTQ